MAGGQRYGNSRLGRMAAGARRLPTLLGGVTGPAATGLAVAGLAVAVMAMAGPQALAQPAAPTGGLPGGSQLPALITADTLTYDETLGTVTASGDVEIVQDGDILRAESVSYNLDTDVVAASGNVVLLDQNGEVYFSEYAELTGDLEEGFIRGIRVLMADGTSRAAAARGIRTGGNRFVFDDAVYTPCELCRENPDRAPVWQLSARKIIHDEDEQVVRYRDATFDVFGVPIFYTPYFEHPDPTVRRQSGFLSPFYSNSSLLGNAVTVPYFWAIDDDSDMTITPTVYAKEVPKLNLEYRQLFPSGSLEVRGSGTIADREESNGTIDENAIRGHIDATGRFNINNRWRTGFDIFRLSDDTYDQIYDIPVPTVRSRVQSDVFVEGFGGRNYFGAEALAYQSLRSEEDDALQPLVLPEIDLSLVSDPLIADSILSSDVNLLYLTREEGREVARASVRTDWTLPYTSDWGDVWTASLSLGGEVYRSVGHDPDRPSTFDTDGDNVDYTGRLFPRATLRWQYPWSIQSGGWEQIFEPMAQAVAAPNGNWFNRDAIPLEDARSLQLDDTNLFTPNRFTGLDRVDPGSRFDYGLRWGVYAPSGGYSELFLGQSYRLSEADVFGAGSGLQDAGASDVVGRVLFQPIPELYTAYRFAYTKDDFDARLHEVLASGGTEQLRLSTTYTFVAGDGIDFQDRETISLSASSRLSENWFVSGSLTRDIVAGLNQSISANVTYADECLRLNLALERRNFQDRDLEPDDRILLTVALTQLGSFDTDFISSSEE